MSSSLKCYDQIENTFHIALAASQIQRDIYTVQILNLLSFQQATNINFLHLFSKLSEKFQSIDSINDKFLC